MSWWNILRGEPLVVRTALPTDRAAVMALGAGTWRRHGNDALDDRAMLLANGLGQVALAGDKVVGFLGLAARAPTGDPPQTWVDMEMVALEPDRPVDQTLQALLAPAIARQQAERATGLICLTAIEWLKAGLQRAGFEEIDQVITYIREARPFMPDVPAHAELRPATAEDAETVLALNAAAFAPLWRYQDATLLNWLLTSEHTVLARLDGRPVGFALTSDAPRNGYAYLIRVATHPAVQGRGIGRQLVADAIRHARATGAPGLALNTQASNAVARRLYESFGFRLAGQTLAVLVYRL